MHDKVKEILTERVEVVIKSPKLSLSLMKCYSVLYLDGRAPKICERLQRKYYLQLKKDGMKKADIIAKAKERTCIPAWRGLRGVPGFGHINSALLYDEQALRCLTEGFLKESDFEKLPKHLLDLKEAAKAKKAKKAKKAAKVKAGEEVNEATK